MYPPSYPGGGPPAAYPGPPAEPPKGPKVFGILSIVFGALTALFQLFGVIVSKAPLGDQGSAVAERFLEETATASLISGLLMLMMAVALIVIGAGQLSYKKWAAQASVIWGVVALLVVVVQAYLVFAVTGPATEALFRDMVATDPSLPDLGGVTQVAAKAALLLYLPYPILMIVYFRRAQVVQAMTR